MKKSIYLCLFAIVLIFACKKSSDDTDFKFTKIEGNKSTATNGVLKLEWQDTKNTSWNIILYNLTDGTKKIIPTNTRSITENVIIGNDYSVVNSKPDTLNPCKGNKVDGIKITNMPDLIVKPAQCSASLISFTDITAQKTSATDAAVTAMWTSSGNTTWDLKITNLTLATPTVSTTIAVLEGSLAFPLDNTQLIEVVGKQNGAAKSFKVLVKNDGNVVVSEFY